MHKVWSLKDAPSIKVHRCRGCWHQAAPPQSPMPPLCSCGFHAAGIVLCYYVLVCKRASAKRNQQQRAKPVYYSSSVAQIAPFRGLSTPAPFPAALPLAHLVDWSWLAAITCGELRGLHCTEQSSSRTAQQKNRQGNAIWQQLTLPAAALLFRCRLGLAATRSASPWPQCTFGSYAAAA